ncbi:MAG: flagellar basal body P-ring formation chaperone FlgA [Armatimonadetes bacterium]|nr:flagellar basal body P-ring formation chaperone FlgA [Armatimonadota bacterium]
MKLAITTILLTLTYATAITGTARSPVTKITLRSRVEVQPAQTVVLKDVAQINGPRNAVQKIESLPVATGPMPGKNSFLDSSEVQQRLQARTGIAVPVSGAQRVELVGKCIRFSTQELANRAREFVLEKLPADGRIFEVTVDHAPKEIVTSFGEAKIRTRTLTPEVRPGPVAVAIDVVVNERVVASTSVTLNVKATAEVLVATKAIRQGEALTPENTVWDQRNVTRKPEALIRSRTDLTSMVAARPISPGELITARDVAASFTVRRGDTVTLTVTCGSVTLRTSAEVRQDARTGDMVRVRPAVSSEDIQAKVLGPGVAIITR